MRRNKGEFVTEAIDEYIVFDLETTGLSPEYDEIIEFSACHVVEGNIVSKYGTLIQPNYSIPEFIEQLTGITNDMLKDKPKIEAVLPDIQRFIKGKILLGHNIHFDLNFLYDVFKTHLDVELNNNYVDMLRVARKVYPEFKTHKLGYLAKMLETKHKPAHRALSDALATHELYEMAKAVIREKDMDFSKLYQSRNKTINDIKSVVSANEEGILNGEVFVFTGTLEKMERKKAWELVVKHGGDIADAVSKKVHYLVLGNGAYRQRLKGGKSSKMRKAEALILQGNELQIISENVFYEMLNTIPEQ